MRCEAIPALRTRVRGEFSTEELMTRRFRLAAAVACAAIFVQSHATVSMAQPAPLRAGMLAAQGDRSLAVNDVLNRWEPIAVQANARDTAWREMFATQLSQLPGMWLDF